MLKLIILILCGAAAGFGCAFAAEAWTKKLLRGRELEYTLTPKAEKLIAAASAVLGGILGGLAESIPSLICGLLLLIVCIVISVTDWTHRIIPNPAVLAIFALKLIFGIPDLLGAPGFPSFRIIQSLIGFAACFILFSLPGLFGKNVGAGDIKLAAAMGFFLGIYGSLIAVIIMGLLVIVFVFAQRQVPFISYFKSYIPMGPFIALGMLAAFAAARWLIL